MRELICAVIIVLVLFGCSDKQAERNSNPSTRTGVPGSAQRLAPVTTGSYALEISPKTAARNSTVNLILTGFDAHDAKIEWLLNGAIAETPSPTQLRLSDARRGDSLQARAFVQGKEILSNIVEITDSLPQITSIRLVPEVSTSGDTLRAEVLGSDPDGDNVTFQYEWTINGMPGGNTEKLEVPFKRGDKINLRVTPFDGEAQGPALSIDREIHNQPPIIQDLRDFQFDGKTLTYQVKATDPDGDALFYSIEGAPNEMKIDGSMGLLTWSVPDGFTGEISPVAVVGDGNGGVCRYRLKFTIK